MVRIPAIARTVALLSGALALAAALLPATANALPGVVPPFNHIVLVMFENKGYDEVVGSPAAPYFNHLASGGALFTDAHGLTHPSQPNYIALFSGDTQGVSDNNCTTGTFAADNLSHQLAGRGLSFAGYAEDIPQAGYTGCVGSGNRYARKHNGWVNFAVPPEQNLPYSAFPANYAQLPTISFVTPNMCNDIHDCPVVTGDNWLRHNLSGYAEWARANNSLLIVTFDEDDNTPANHIPTIFYGAHVRPGRYAERIDHYSVLRTMEDAYLLPPLGHAAGAAPITSVWSLFPWDTGSATPR